MCLFYFSAGHCIANLADSLTTSQLFFVEGVLLFL